MVNGQIRNLLINVPPRTSKSSITSVAFPAWVWTQRDRSPLKGPQVQFLFASYSHTLSMRDSLKTRRLVESPWYQDRWGDRFEITGDQNTKIRFENDKGGYRLATSTGGSLTGEGAMICVADDAMNAIEAESQVIREGVISWWDEALSTRLNDPKTGAFIVIMQRLHQEDLAGHILKRNTGDWTHLCLPMEYDPGRHCVTSIGWEDPRTEEGELLCPERFGPNEVKALKSRLGPTAAAGQLQQIPEPKGGGILKRDWWGVYELELGAQPRHQFEYIVASLDPAFTSKQENDPSGFVVLGVYREMGRPKIVLLHAWKKWLELHGRTIEREHNEDAKTYRRRAMPEWGLVEWVAHDCQRLRVNTLLIEDKASGHSVAQEIKRLYFDKTWGVSLQNPGNLDKRARAYAVQHMFADGMIEAPASTRGEVYEFREFAQMTIDECAKFRGLSGDEDNIVDALTQALKYVRDRGIAQRADEVRSDEEFFARHKPKSELPYDV